MKTREVTHHTGYDGTVFATLEDVLEALRTGAVLGPTPGASTDNAVARWDTTTGRLLQNSGVIIDDSDNITVPGSLQTSQSAGNTLLLRAYDVDGAAYVTFATLTANNTPTLDLAAAVTLGGVAIATLNTNTWAQQQGFARVSLTDASTITWNAQTQQSAYVLLTSGVGGTRALGAPSNLVSGFTYTLMVQQSSTGSNALTYNAVYKWVGGAAPVLSTANNAIDILTFLSDGTNMYGVAQKNFKLMFTFPVTLWASSNIATRTFQQSETPQTAAASTFTFTNANIGTAAADRYVVVVISCSVGTAGRTLNSVTIGGNAATLHVNANTSVAASSTTIVGIAGLLVTSGTTATVVANFSGNMNTCYCRVYTLNGLTSSTPTATKTTSVSSGTVASNTIDIADDGILIFGAHAFTSTGSWTEVGATEDSDQNTNNQPSCSASDQNLLAQTGRTHSATISANTPAIAMAAAAWYGSTIAATRTHTDATSSAAATNTYTFSSRALGTEQGTSLVVVLVTCWGSGIAGTTQTAGTINGVAATLHQVASGIQALSNSSIATVMSAVTSGTTGNIVCTFNQTMSRCRISVYRLNFLSSTTPTASNKATTTGGTSLNTTFNVASGGIPMACLAAFACTAGSQAISNITNDAVTNELGNNYGTVDASDENQSASTPLSITGSWTTTSSGGLAGASWS